jgi:hypothetical protein
VGHYSKNCPKPKPGNGVLRELPLPPT